MPGLVPSALLLLINLCYVVNTNIIIISFMDMRNREGEALMPSSVLLSLKISRQGFIFINFPCQDTSCVISQAMDWLIFNHLRVRSQSLGAKQSSLAWTVVGQASWLIYLVHPLNYIIWGVLSLFVCLLVLILFVFYCLLLERKSMST